MRELHRRRDSSLYSGPSVKLSYFICLSFFIKIIEYQFALRIRTQQCLITSYTNYESNSSSPTIIYSSEYSVTASHRSQLSYSLFTNALTKVGSYTSLLRIHPTFSTSDVFGVSQDSPRILRLNSIPSILGCTQVSE
jgi:hypothetical protein